MSTLGLPKMPTVDTNEIQVLLLKKAGKMYQANMDIWQDTWPVTRETPLTYCNHIGERDQSIYRDGLRWQHSTKQYEPRMSNSQHSPYAPHLFPKLLLVYSNNNLRAVICFFDWMYLLPVDFHNISWVCPLHKMSYLPWRYVGFHAID